MPKPLHALIAVDLIPTKGARWFHTRDHGGGLNLSKASLGEFLYEALKRGWTGIITSHHRHDGYCQRLVSG